MIFFIEDSDEKNLNNKLINSYELSVNNIPCWQFSSDLRNEIYQLYHSGINNLDNVYGCFLNLKNLNKSDKLKLEINFNFIGNYKIICLFKIDYFLLYQYGVVNYVDKLPRINFD